MARSYRPYRKRDPHSYAVGVFDCLELFTSGHAVEALVVAEGEHANRGLVRLRELAADRGLPVIRGDRLLARLSGKDNCLAVGVYTKRDARLAADRDHLVLVEPADMGNLGTIARAMLGFGMHDLALIGQACDHHHSRAVRASMGALFHLRVERFPDAAAYRAAHDRLRYAFFSDGAQELTAVRWRRPCSLVFGNESSGLDPTWREDSEPVRIRHESSIDSLNLSLAAGIALHAFASARS